jgi:hypothetical protein
VSTPVRFLWPSEIITKSWPASMYRIGLPAMRSAAIVSRNAANRCGASRISVS